MHVRLPLCNPPRTKQPYQLLESRTLPLPSLKKTSIVREDGLRVLCRNFLDSSLVVQFQISVSCREKAQQHRLLYILTIEFFLPSKEKYRIKIYSKLSESKFSSDFSLSLSLFLSSTQVYNSKWSRNKVHGSFVQKNGAKFEFRPTINSISPRSKSLISFDF